MIRVSSLIISRLNPIKYLVYADVRALRIDVGIVGKDDGSSGTGLKSDRETSISIDDDVDVSAVLTDESKAENLVKEEKLLSKTAQFRNGLRHRYIPLQRSSCRNRGQFCRC